MEDQPNILFVFPDQLSARWLPCYGYETVDAANLDRFALESVQFSRAYTNCPLCTPYRACLFTGRYPSQTGVMRNGMCLPTGQRTIADHLNEAGYDTHYIGKWHLSGNPQKNRWVPPDQRGGFKHFIGWESHHVDHNAGLIWYDDPDSPVELRGHETDGLTDIVCSELESLASTTAPFFMTVSYQAPHPPCSPPLAYLQRYDHTVLDGPPGTVPEARFSGWGEDQDVEAFRKNYFAEISHLDAAFGRVLDTLEATGLAENTIVIFTSDHGDMAGCHGLYAKAYMFDESVRVPLLVRLPEGRVRAVDTPVSTVDLFATILDIANVEAEAEGRSVLPSLNGELQETTDVFIELKEDCIIRGDLKLITKPNENEVLECYDLAEDPYELNNLAETLDLGVKASLLSALNDWRRRVRE